MNVIIAGSRNVRPEYYRHFRRTIQHQIDMWMWEFESHRTEVTIISGGARGADQLGEVFAIENAYKLKVMEADWKKHGRKAGMLRNEEMEKVADALIAIWDGRSVGTKNMIYRMRDANKPVFIIDAR